MVDDVMNFEDCFVRAFSGKEEEEEKEEINGCISQQMKELQPFLPSNAYLGI
jgi:hypothetical protein